MVGHDLAALNTSTNTAMSEINHQSQEQRILTENELLIALKCNNNKRKICSLLLSCIIVFFCPKKKKPNPIRI